ncbi:MAG: hypothetical protein ACI9TI_000813 [Natronomonas sp.]|jgi:hypothetical protein|uniref:hypothetical protein n=1 Tax=Natronomonas sp. TaxID=2184060 RepID=UPI003988E0E4
MSREDESLGGIGWEFDVDSTTGEIHLEHTESGSAYILDADGGLRVPGNVDVGSELGALQETLTAALRADGPEHRAVTDGGQAGRCNIECDETTGEVTIESETDISMKSGGTISLAAPQIELSADGNATVDANGVLTLQGALVELN